MSLIIPERFLFHPCVENEGMSAVPKNSQESGSYRSILKSTSLIGGASLINMLISMAKKINLSNV
jgi:hypothetical protein